MRRISSGQQQCSEKQCCCQWTETDQWSASRKKVCFSFKEYDSSPFTPGPPNHDSNSWPSLVRRPLMCNVQERERGGVCWPLRPHSSSSNISTVTRAACGLPWKGCTYMILQALGLCHTLCTRDSLLRFLRLPTQCRCCVT